MKPDELNELRLFYLASDAILPLIREQANNSYEKLLNRFREGETNLLPLVAQCSAQQSLIDDIHDKLALYESINQENI